MNGMDDDGHAGEVGGEPAKDSRLAAVGVDDFRLLRESINSPSIAPSFRTTKTERK